MFHTLLDDLRATGFGITSSGDIEMVLDWTGGQFDNIGILTSGQNALFARSLLKISRLTFNSTTGTLTAGGPIMPAATPRTFTAGSGTHNFITMSL
jgi:hypothetical protein